MPTVVVSRRESSLTTENVAILFTDVVGSTALSQRVSPEVADEVRREHFAILRQAIAGAGGTEVKSLGDGLMVVFGSASAAMACAVTMQQGVDRDNGDREHSVGLRVGLSGGEVTREEEDYFGDPVVEAARLCASCEAGQILAADVVRAVAGRRSRQAFRPLGPMSLKGLPEPVETVEVLWEPVGVRATSIPLPARLAVRPSVGLVGRDAEIQSITEAMKRVGGGAGREVVLISGEAGLGKTTLVAEASRSAFEAGWCVLLGHCEEELATPYQLFAEALGHYVTHAPEDQLVAHVRAHGSELSRLVPALSSRITDLPRSKATDSDTERYLLFAAVVGLLTMVSQIQPVVLVLDDLQWADTGSLLLLRHFVATEQSMRVQVFGTYRDNELSQAHALRDALGVLRRHDGVSRIELTGLDDDEVVAFLEAAAGQTLDDAALGLAHAVYRETDGNPFFVGEVLRHLSETGAIYQDATGRWTSDGSLERTALPNSVREVIGGRVVRLGTEAARVLSMAAVIGKDFDLDVLARATATDEDSLLDILESAAGVALVREPVDALGRYSFAHALIQHTLYEDLGPNRQARAHRHVAEALEELCGDHPGARVGELARHWIGATQPIDVDKAMRYSRQAGDAALRAMAPADALRHYHQALDLYRQSAEPDPTLGIDLAIGIGTAQRQTGDPAFRLTLLDAARQAADLDDTDRLVAAALANDRGFFSVSGTIDTDKVEILESALARLPADHRDRALVLATLCSELTYGSPLERRQALADEAIAIAGSGDDSTMVWVLNHVFVPLCVPPLIEASRGRTTDALVRAEKTGDPVALFFAAGFRVCTAMHLGDMAEADRYMEVQSTRARQLDQPLLNWINTWIRAERAQIAGDTDQAERLVTEALQVGTDAGQPDVATFFGAQLMIVKFQRGTIGDMVPLMEGMQTSDPDLAPVLGSLLALAHVEGDRPDEALVELEGLAANDFTLPFDPLWLAGMSGYSEAVVQCRARDYAGPLFDQLAPWAHLVATAGGLTSVGPVSHYLGGLATVLGRYDDADAYFVRAAAMSRDMGAKFSAARTNLSWGRMLAERKAQGDIEQAHTLFTTAHAVAAANGYGTVERRAAVALQLLDT